jgi:hypothetical protein
MTTLRKQFIESLQSQGISAHTQEEYVCAVSQLAQFYDRSPARIPDQEILEFLNTFCLFFFNTFSFKPLFVHVLGASSRIGELS